MATPETYIRCARSRAGMKRKTAGKLSIAYLEIEAGHDPMISQPEVLAAMLADL